MKCCDECSYWDKEQMLIRLEKRVMRHWKVLLFVAALAALFGCAAPHFDDGTRASYSVIPCHKDDCGKLPDGF